MRDKTAPDYYRILGLAPTATDLEIKASYRALSKKHHPDMGGSHADMATINAAYRVLSDKFKRNIYDAERKRAIHVPPRTTPTTAQQAANARRPAPRAHAQTQFTAHPRRRANWWVRLAWGFAGLVVAIGLITHLPIAEALSANTPDAPTTQPLNVTYEPATTASTPTASSTTPSTAIAAPQTSEGTPAPTVTTPSPEQQKTESCDTANDEPCQQTATKKNCVTKSIGFYKHTVCANPGGTTTCETTLGTTYRNTSCR